MEEADHSRQVASLFPALADQFLGKEKRSGGGRVLMAASSEEDTEALAEVLTDAGLSCGMCQGVDCLLEQVGEETGAIVLAEEELSPGAVEQLQEHLAAQAAWSSLPVVLLVEASPGREEVVRALGQHASVVALEKPVQALTFKTVIRAALQARGKQHEVRELTERLKGKLGRRAKKRMQEVTQAELRERQRIAQVLHDSLQQLLFGLAMKLEKLQAFLHSTQASKERGKLGELLKQMFELLQEAVSVTRSLAHELNPPVLQSESFEIALQWLGLHMKERYGLTVALSMCGELRIPDENLRIFLFQVVRELLFNVVKHAGTDEAEVEVKAQDGRLILCVRDEGKGIDLSGQQNERGSGLATMRQRLERIEGGVEIESVPEEGTCVTIFLAEGDWELV